MAIINVIRYVLLVVQCITINWPDVLLGVPHYQLARSMFFLWYHVHINWLDDQEIWRHGEGG